MQKILVIEDSATTRQLIIQSLVDEYEVIEAYDGLNGTELALQTLPDLIICDISMPNRDGFGVLDALQENEATSSIPFIFLTAFNDQNTMRRGMNLGADDFLIKPFTLQELKTAVQTRLFKKALRDTTFKREIDALRTNITTSLPHELRTAVMVIEGYTQLMKENPNQEPVEQHNEMLDMISQYASRLYQLSERFLWYTRSHTMSGEEITIQPTLNCDNLIEETAYKIAAQYKRTGDLHLTLEGEGTRLTEESFQCIVTELIDNAFKFSLAGRPVTIHTTMQNGHYLFSIVDRGCGMESHQIKQIGGFMQFDRIRYEQQGTGLGLATAKKLTEIAGGVFDITSIVDKGTAISLQLPGCTEAEFMPARVGR